MKSLAVKVAGTNQEPLDISIQPGTTAGDILEQLNLQGYLLSKDASADKFFGATENVYPQVGDGEKLFATAKTEVGK
jgi:hypothetical protein